ncbi:MAG: hypothetical protein RI935_239 [Candidatus Parcubacteria bacterium]|jgi:hypothetical protein
MKPANLKTRIFLYILETRQTTTLRIVEHFKKAGYTKQGVYKILRLLHSEGKILWVKTHIEVHLLWLHDEIELLAKALPKKEIVFQTFTEKKQTYKIKTLTELENVYGQIFISIISSLQGTIKNFLFYDVHNYTYVNTVPIVDWYIDFIFKNKGSVHLLVGSKSPLDLALKKKSKMKSIQIHCIDKKWGVNLSVFGDYVITVHTGKKTLDAMNSIFKNNTEESARKPLEKLYNEKSLHKIVVERNSVKAKEIEKEFRKYFVLK